MGEPGNWKFTRDKDSGLGRFVVTFHWNGDFEFQKKHVLYERGTFYTTNFKEAGGNKEPQNHVLMSLMA